MEELRLRTVSNFHKTTQNIGYYAKDYWKKIVRAEMGLGFM